MGFRTHQPNSCRAHTSLVAAQGLSTCPGVDGILVPQPGIEPTPPTLKGISLTTEPPKKSHGIQIFFFLHDSVSAILTFFPWLPWITIDKGQLCTCLALF